MSAENLFSSLSAEQYQDLKQSLVNITVLVAGADGTIDSQELNWAEKLTHIRSYANPEMLNGFYQDVESTFNDDLNAVISDLPGGLDLREEILSKRLEGLNKIFLLLDNHTAYNLYKSFTSFAEHIAKASGGFLRFGSISNEEKKWIELPMVTPIILEESEGEV